MKANLTCEACERELSAYADGALTPAVARVIDAHVDGCASCSGRLRSYRWITERLAELPDIPVPVGLERRVLRAVRGPSRVRVLWGRTAAATAALCFAGTIGLVASLPRIARALGLPDPLSWPLLLFRGAIEALATVPKRLALDIAFYDSIAKPIWLAFQSLESIPRAVLLSVRTPEGQVAGVVLFTLGVAFYFMMRTSRRPERGIGHACLTL